MPPTIHFKLLKHESIITGFSCGHHDLDDFLRSDSMEYQTERLSITHLAYLDTELIGFFTLVTDCIDAKQVNTQDGKRGYPYRKYPAIKVARLAIDTRYQRKGLGFQLLGEVLSITITISKYVGCRIITVDSKPESVSFYEKYGFKRAKRSQSDTISMYMDYLKLLEEENLDL